MSIAHGYKKLKNKNKNTMCKNKNTHTYIHSSDKYNQTIVHEGQ